MKADILVSILIPLYNAESYIEDAIACLLRQTYKNIELIIVDDHSTDNSLVLARKYEAERVHIFENPKKGGNSARNYAFQMSKGEYVKFMDADDFCTDNMIEKQLERMIKDGDNLSLVFSSVKMLYPDGHLFLPPREIDRDHTPGIELLIDIWRGKGWNCPHCHLMHRDLVAVSGGWDEKIIKNQDGEFFARVAACASKSLYVPDVYAVWRQTGIGVSTKKSLDAYASVIATYSIITNLILQYQNNSENRYCCAKYIGGFVYGSYPDIKLLMPQVYAILDKIKQPVILPKRRILMVLRLFFGWKLALNIIHKYNL